MLLLKDRKQRLGQKKDAEEVLGHKFFADVDVQALLSRKIEAEFLPAQDYIKNFDSDIVNQDPSESVVPQEAKDQIKVVEDQFANFGFGTNPND